MSGQGDGSAHLKIYELYLDDLGRIGSRHETARQFYITVLSAIIAFLALAGKDGIFTALAPSIRIIAGVTGALICLLWLVHMRSFAGLYVIKFGIIDGIEETLPLAPFTSERRAANSSRRHHLTNIDSAAAMVFLLLFATLSLAGYAT
jgi:hypothetical protein